MATTTFHEYTGDGSDKTFDYSFPTYLVTEVKVQVDGVIVDNYTVPSYATTGTKTVTFDNSTGSVNSTVCEASGAPKTGLKVRVYRDTAIDAAKHTYSAGESVKAGDLNTNQEQVLRALQEEQFNTTTTADIADGAISGAKIKNDAIDSQHYAADSIDAEHYAPNSVDTTALAPDAVTNAQIANNSIDSEHYVVGSIDTAHLADNAVNPDKLADDAVTSIKIKDLNVTEGKLADESVTSAKIKNATITATDIANDTITGTQIATTTITSAHLADGAVTGDKLAAGAVTAESIPDDAIISDKIADNAINSEHYVDGSIDREHLAAGIVDGTKIAANAIDSDHYVDGSIDVEHLAANSVGEHQYVDGSIKAAHVANDAIDSQHYAFQSIDAEHIANDAIDSQHYAAGSIDNEHMAADSVNTDQYVDGSIGSIHLATGIVTNIKMAANSIDSDQYVNGSIDTEHYAAGSVDTTAIATNAVTANELADNAVDTNAIANTAVNDTKLASNAVTSSKITDANVTTLKIADSNVTLGKLHSDLKKTTISDSDTQIPTSGAVVDYVAAQLAPVGGLAVIATDAAFPNTQPASGVVISIADAGGLVVNGSGVSTTGRTVGNSTVTINQINSAFYDTTVDAGVAFMVSSTGSGQTYNFHKATLKEADILSLSGDINDFAERYRVSADPDNLPSKDEGDLVYDTATNKMKVYDNSTSTWKEVASAGDFKYLFLCPFNGTGAPTLDGSIAKYDLRESSNSGSAASISSAAQLLVSINGVIQKANTGTSAPSEGFALVDTNTIIFGDDLESSDSVFIVQIGSAVSIPTPGDGTVSAAKLVSGAVETAKIADGAVDNSKIADDTIAEAKLDIHQAPADGKFLKYTSSNGMEWGDVPAGVGGATGVVFNDNVKAGFGAGNSAAGDLQIWQDATGARGDSGVNKIESLGAHLDIQSNNNISITVPSSSNSGADTPTKMAFFQPSNSVELYYNGNKKFETSNTGATVTGTLIADLADDSIDSEHYVDGSIDRVHIADNVVDLPQIAHQTQGDILYYAASGVPTLLTAGTDGHFLKTQGSGANPVWAAAGGGVESNAAYDTIAGTDAGANLSTSNASGKNSFFGYYAGRRNTSSTNNTAVGYNALENPTSSTNHNTAIGSEAAASNDTGSNMTAVGSGALKNVTGGSDNVAVGYSAMYANEGGKENVAVGTYSLDANTSGNENVAIGHYALSAANASDNVAVGFEALKDCTSSSNVAVGAYAATDVTSGDKNVAIGYEANKVNASGSSNVVIGHSAMKTTTASNQCVAIGYEANMTEDGGNSTTAVGALALRLSTQHGNTAVGHGAMSSATTAWDCTAVGKSALSGCLDSQENTAVGNNALVADCGGKNTAVGHLAGTAVTGVENTCIGVRAGVGITSGNANTCVGEYAGKYIQSGFDNIYIGRDSHAGAEGDDGAVVVGINLGSKGEYKAFIGGSSGAYNEQNYSTWATTSDRRIKKNITNNTTGLDKINQITVRNFEYKKFKKDDEGVYLEDSNGKFIPETTDDEITWSEFNSGNIRSDSIIVKKTGTQVGVIAQELEPILPGLVDTDQKHGLKSVNTDNLVWYLVNAVKELSTKNDALEARIAALEAG